MYVENYFQYIPCNWTAQIDYNLNLTYSKLVKSSYLETNSTVLRPHMAGDATV